jgi:hypothetical protein
MTIQTYDLTWVRGSVTPLILALGAGFTDVRIRAYKSGGDLLAFSQVLADATLDVTDAPSGTVTFTPTADMTNALTPNNLGVPQNLYTVETKVGGLWNVVLSGTLGAVGGGGIGVTPPAAGGAAPDPIPFALSVFFPGKPTDAQVIFRHDVIVPFDLPAGLTGSLGKAIAASTGNVACSIKKGATEVGTITYNASATGVLAMASATSFADGDVLTIVAPATADATLANLSVSLLGERT